MRLVVRVLLCGIAAGVGLATVGCAPHTVRAASAAAPPVMMAPAPVVVSGMIREGVPGDYLRIGFLPKGVAVTSIARPGAIRGFATATPTFMPPLKVKELPLYSGLENNDASILVAMRCRPPHPEKVDALLATWPNVFTAIGKDVPLAAGACDGSPTDPATQAACYAKDFSDAPATVAPTALARTMSYAATIFDASHAAMAKWLRDNYGIFPAFGGMGYSVKDSYRLDSQPMTSQQMLVKSISPEYILKNVSLAEAGCRCVSVQPHAGRGDEGLDPEFIAREGGDGVCKEVGRLGR